MNYVLIGVNILLGLLYTPYMLRMLGQNEYGLYSLVATIIAYLTLFDFGMGTAVVRYTAKFRSRRGGGKPETSCSRPRRKTSIGRSFRVGTCPLEKKFWIKAWETPL